MNNSTDTVEALNDLPDQDRRATRPIFLRDVAHVRDGYSVQTNSVSSNGSPATLMTIRKTGGVSTLGVIDGIKETVNDRHPEHPSHGDEDQGDLRSVDLRQGRPQQRA